MNDEPNFDTAAALATTVLTINVNAKYPGTIDPKNANAYLSALRDARESCGLPQSEGTPLVENLLHVMFRLAAFAAGRGEERPAELVRAFAQSLADDTGSVHDGQATATDHRDDEDAPMNESWEQGPTIGDDIATLAEAISSSIESIQEQAVGRELTQEMRVHLEAQWNLLADISRRYRRTT